MNLSPLRAPSHRAYRGWRDLLHQAAFCLGFLGIIGPGSLGAQSLSTQEAAETFFVESLRIEGAERTQQEVIESTSRLRAGKSYSEAELQQGRHRIVGLPFIREVELSFEKGSAPGLLILVVRIVEAKTWFWAFDIGGEFVSSPFALANVEPATDHGNLVGLLGRQFFLGRSGVLTTAIGGRFGELHLRYVQYNLLGRGIGLDLSYGHGLCEEDSAEGIEICSSETANIGVDPTFSTWARTGEQRRIAGSLTVPMSSTLSLLGQAELRHVDDGFKYPAFQPEPQTRFRYRDLKQIDLRIASVWDTLDDPVASMSGERFELALSHRRTRGDFESFDRDTELSETGASASLVRYRPMGPFSLFFKGDVFVGRSRWDNLPIEGRTTLSDSSTALRAGLSVGHAAWLWRSGKPGRLSDLRLETELSTRWDGLINGSDLPRELIEGPGSPLLDGAPLRTLEVRSSLVYRNRRTVLRFSLGYREIFYP